MAASSSYQPRSLAVRDLDGIPFEVMILRSSCDGAAYDVIYLDDGNVERSVAASDLDPTAIAGGACHPANLDSLMQTGLQQLEEEREIVKNFDSKTSEGDPILAPVVRSTEEMSKFLIDDDVSVCHTARSLMASTPLAKRVESPAQSLASTLSTAASEDVGVSGGQSPARPGFKLMQAPVLGASKVEAAPPEDPLDAASAADAAAAAAAAAATTACGAGVRGIRSLRRNRSSAGLA
mmetsp:Transcript_29855/g.64619  ORF Transcript_29855/g.64619 Transcript_29855/m.64619 type:complete len:236 (-) Transcript_29855:60-767(-)|eukprot:CAMPEP_0206507670 /NCGR_PEP_ID=MMETSP0324_2-20121206/57696_1 /ASSEMBLY_ACC=CAM_ASM_000836 /TAXON_ID=2866 /ORGANISM="Crypthecodinium cohnii, Strain Seligo" /LENGTH=235 /DNA_ID=CAMNT_0053998029 /DNA_START=385 /DNA_END=1092 /DNA_ORIENTATION=-